MKTLIQKVEEEFEKVNLEIELVKECNDKFIISVLENGKIILSKWEVSKSLQWNKIDNFVKMTRENVDRIKELIKLGMLKEGAK